MKRNDPKWVRFGAAACMGAVALGGVVVISRVGLAAAPAARTPDPGGELRAPESFAGIADRDERARALFQEASRVLLHPRCRNCHPDGDSPLQGDKGLLHDPPVARGADDRGVPGLLCESCHQDKNLELARVPGAPNWHLSPRSMAWAGRTLKSLCEQLKDPARNGSRTLLQIVEHSAHDPLIAWGWSPGALRTPAPGTQERFGALMAAWVKDGAACPREGVTR